MYTAEARTVSEWVAKGYKFEGAIAKIAARPGDVPGPEPCNGLVPLLCFFRQTGFSQFLCLCSSHGDEREEGMFR